MRFLGKEYTRETQKPTPQGPSDEFAIRQLEGEALKSAAAHSKQFEAAKAAQARQRRAENRAIAQMLNISESEL